MSNWALELQQFNIERIWIRGEANILADAPSRAPWEEKLAQFLPIPDMPVRDLVIKLYQAPDEVEELVSRRRQVLTGEQEWTPLPATDDRDPPRLERSTEGGAETPNFGSGTRTPDFGEPESLARFWKRKWARGLSCIAHRSIGRGSRSTCSAGPWLKVHESAKS